MPALITTDLVALDADLGGDKERRHPPAGRTGRRRRPGHRCAAGLHDDVIAREAQAATGLPGGIAIPHCRSEDVDRGFSRLRPAEPDGRLRAP